MPTPVVYVLVFVAFALARQIVGWADGSHLTGSIYFLHLIDAFNPIFLLFVTHLLDQLAEGAFATYRSVVSGGDVVADGLLYRLTTLPARSTLVFSLLGLVAGAVYLPLATSPQNLADSLYFTSTTAVVVDTALSALQGVAMALFGWHAIHQLFWISRIYSRYTDISIFHIGPLYSLSRVTAMTAVTLLVFSYLFAGWSIDYLSNAIILGSLLLTAALTFVLPLYGAHRLLVAAKNQQLGEAAQRIEASTKLLHGRIDAGEYAEVDAIASGLGGLETERRIVAKAPTWPWDPDAVRVVLTALLVPIVLWLITRVLESLVG